MPLNSCKICKKIFKVKQSHLAKGWGKYCSKHCQNQSQKTGKLIKCKLCLKPTWKTPREVRKSRSQNFFCGKSCQAIWRNQTYVAEKHTRWTNGINAYRNLIKRARVAEVCRDCDHKDKRVLIVHHIDHDRTNNSLENLVWLCRNCHYLIHNGKTI